MHKITLPLPYIDKRGKIQDLLVEPIDAITQISFENSAIRGNHVHKETTQWTFVLNGLLEVFTIVDGLTKSSKFSTGDFFVSNPGEPHAMQALEKSEILVFTRGPRSGASFESDTYPLEIIS